MTSHTDLCFTAGVDILTDTVFSVRCNTDIYVIILLCRLQAVPLPLHHHSVPRFIPFSLISLSPGSRSHPLSPSLPNSHSVQRQATGSQRWLDFHTVPSTERHIKLIRVNNCGGALLSRAPIGLAWPGSGHTDGLVISDLRAEGTDDGGGTSRAAWGG